ncbi:MAG: glutaminyl-peptide cyclotransferase [Brumimicrobium sp.]|nr:glutaminyl-peptide cyclotransferase [Brumimicrobium sp.]MCO5267386.1 glutaminyl-peptide cyclotransferase [Brumimicrobium sp.]
MKLPKLLFRVCLLSLLFITSCTDDKTIEKGSLVPARFDLPFNNANVQRGQTIRISLEILAEDDIEKISIFTKDTSIYEGNVTDAQKIFEVNTRNWNIGTNQISLKVVTKNKGIKTENRIIKIFPDVFPKEYTAEVVQEFPHNTSSYTQGLEFSDGELYEGTGGRADGTAGESMLAKVNLKNGEILQKKMLDHKYFGEGITLLNNKIYQITWQEHTCFVYDKNTFTELTQLTYTGEGWGLCNNGTQIIMSDGSERIYFRDPENFTIQKTIEVYSNAGPIRGLNELEYINGKIYANVYTENYIVIIDPSTGIVTGRIDATTITLDYRKTGEVLNGIAYNPLTKQLFITGKRWPSLLEIALIEE